MKLNKIFAVVLAALAMTACDHDNGYDYPNLLEEGVNSAKDVTVSLPATFSVNENQIPSYIPVTVTGTPNGKVVVTVEVKTLTQTPAGTEPAVYGDHFNLTSYTINIPKDDDKGYIEITPVWAMGEINDDRVFEMTIKSVEGASIGNATSMITIVNVDDPYTSMLGSWTMTCKRNGVDVSYRINLTTPDPSDETYGSDLCGFGILDSDYQIPFTNFQYDETTGQGTMEIGYGYLMTDNAVYNYGSPVGLAAPLAYWRTDAGSITMDHTETVTFDSSYSEIVFPATANIVMGLYGYESGVGFTRYTGYTLGTYTDIRLTR